MAAYIAKNDSGSFGCVVTSKQCIFTSEFSRIWHFAMGYFPIIDKLGNNPLHSSWLQLLSTTRWVFANHLYTHNSIRMSTTHTITQSSESQPLCIVAAARASKAFTQSKWWVELIDWLVFHTTLHIWRVFFSQKNIYSGCRMNTVHNT